jgi:RNA polymerase sigma-70 factor (ECF subfamily)
MVYNKLCNNLIAGLSYFCNKSGYLDVFIIEPVEKHCKMVDKSELEGIIEKCKRAETEGFSQLVDLYSRRCYGYFYRLTGNRTVSDDLLSELFVKVVKKINSYRGGSFEAWLFRVASNIFHDHLRDKQKQEKVLQGHKEKLESIQKTGSKTEDERIDRLQSQLLKLDDETRELIMLRFYSQASFKQIASMRAEPIGTTLSKLHRGLKKLRILME